MGAAGESVLPAACTEYTSRNFAAVFFYFFRRIYIEDISTEELCILVCGATIGTTGSLRISGMRS